MLIYFFFKTYYILTLFTVFFIVWVPLQVYMYSLIFCIQEGLFRLPIIHLHLYNTYLLTNIISSDINNLDNRM